MSKAATRVMDLLSAAFIVDAIVFLAAALQNFGTHIPLGFAELYFPAPIWQAGIGEAVIGLALLAAAVMRRAVIEWIAFWLSVAGIVFGLSSVRVQGPARDIHIILVPLAIVVFGLLLWVRQQRLRLGKEAPGQGSGTGGEK